MALVGRARTIDTYHLDLLPDILLTGSGMPIIDPCDVVPDDLMSFNYMLSRDNFDAGIHFFVDDYQFERVYKRPDAYVDRLRNFCCVLTPDFSLYRDMPLPMQRWNCYRSRFVGAYWQQRGLDVIPTLQWADSRSYTFAFDGLPTHSIVAVSTLGCLNDDMAMRMWINGFEEAIDALQPKLVLLYGKPIHGYDIPCDYKIYDNANVRRLKWVDVEHRQAEAARAVGRL